MPTSNPTPNPPSTSTLNSAKDAPKPPPFLVDALQHCSLPPPPTRPHVTLTFAQSLDAKIAGAGGRQLILSGAESMRMTHWMRTMHDAILVGVRTAINDDPQLNVRHLPPPAPTSPSPAHPLPRPIIADTHLRLPPTSKLLLNFHSHTGRQPWVLCAPHPQEDAAFQDRRRVLEAAGARVVEVRGEVGEVGEVASTEREREEAQGLPLAALLQTLRSLGISSLMVEGGARIIASFLAERTVVDALLITVAPVLVGGAGVGYSYPTTLGEDGSIVPRFRAAHTEIVGKDSVVVLSPIS